jgi:hypothetical protein
VKEGTGLDGQQTTGVVPVSKTNVIGTPLGNATAAMQIAYQNSVALSFDLASFYFGCVLGTLENTNSAPTPCKVAVGGYNTAGKRVALAQFTFTPPPRTLKANMVLATLDATFKGLSRAIFVTSYNVRNQLGAALFDNFEYTVFANITH